MSVNNTTHNNMEFVEQALQSSGMVLREYIQASEEELTKEQLIHFTKTNETDPQCRADSPKHTYTEQQLVSDAEQEHLFSISVLKPYQINPKPRVMPLTYFLNVVQDEREKNHHVMILNLIQQFQKMENPLHLGCVFMLWTLKC